MADQPAPLEFSRPVRIAKLNPAETFAFDETATGSERTSITTLLAALDVPKMRFHGTLKAVGKTAWQLEGELGATVVQTCVVSLVPVKTRIDTHLTRLFLPLEDFETRVKSSEEDIDNIEELTTEIDLGQIALEALSLALPDYPRAAGVSLEDAVFAAQGVVPMTDEDAKPFAGLAALKDKLDKP